MKKILLVDDHDVVRDGVKKILDEHLAPVTFGEAETMSEALKLIRDQEWDIVVLDISLVGRSGLDGLKEMMQIQKHLRVLVLSMHSEEQYARRAFKAGAAGYITKDSPRTELVAAVKKVMQGGRYVSPALAERLVIDLGGDPDRSAHEILSDREYEVMSLIASGKTVGEIARDLKLSDRTISTYRTRLLEKMALRTNAELTHYAFMHKLVG